MSQTTATRRPKQAKTRRCGVVERHGNHSLLEVVESTSKSSKTGYYLCEEYTPAWGTTAYRLEKEDGTTYDVLINDVNEHHTCDCPGHVQHGHKTRCKHVAMLTALRHSGKLPGWTPFPKPSSLVELGRPFRPGYDDEENIFRD